MSAPSEVVVATLMRPAGGSGVQSHVRTFAEHLREASYPVTVVSPFESEAKLLRPVFGARYALRPVSRSAAVWWYRVGHAHYLADALADHLRTPAGSRVLYAQCPVSADVALRVRTTQPVVMAAHFNLSQADEWADKGELSRDGRHFRAIRSFEERVLPQLDGVVYVSEFSRATTEERIPALRAVPSMVVPNCVPPSHAASGARPGPVVGDLVTVGCLEPRKNQGYLLEVLRAAADRGRRFSLSIIGDGPDRRWLEHRAAHLGLADQVRFQGYRADPRPLMAGHRLYCHTATVESFGIVLAEAMAEGLPVLAGAVGGVPEVVRAGQEGQFWPLDDAAGAAETLIELMDDDPLLAVMGVRARQRAVTEFSAAGQCPRLHQFLASARVRRTRVEA
jgi:glycosyltransferase involved in cell wall biosynthesis